MTNVSGEGKVPVRRVLRGMALDLLKARYDRVEKVRGTGKSSLFRASKGGKTDVVTIRTSQDAWFAFPRNADDTGWSTLEDADLVLVASLTEKGSTLANFHLIPADEVRTRFDNAYAARKAANYTIPLERGIWISLYDKHATDPVRFVGAGLGLDYEARPANVPVFDEPTTATEAEDDEDEVTADTAPVATKDDGPLTIPEAKARLAKTFGVSPDQIKITVEG